MPWQPRPTDTIVQEINFDQSSRATVIVGYMDAFRPNPIRFSQRNQKSKHNSSDPHVCGSAIHFAHTSANKENLLLRENRDDPIRKPTRKENPNNSIARTERLAKIKTLAAIEQTSAADLRRAAGASAAAIIAHEEHRRSYRVLQSSSARTD